MEQSSGLAPEPIFANYSQDLVIPWIEMFADD